MGLLGIRGQLGEGDAVVLLDARQPRGAVGTHARQHDADGHFLVCDGQRTEEHIDRCGGARYLFQCLQHQVAVLHQQAAGGRNHVHVVGKDRGRVIDLHDRQAGRALQDPVSVAVLVSGKMKNHDQGHARRWRQMPEQCRQRRKAAGGGADADDGEG